VSFRTLLVCTGNVCRSPMAELLVRSWADGRADVTVSSAGVRALTGEGIDAGSAVALRRYGLDPAQHRARQVTPALVAEADLVLTAERAHRDQLIRDAPAGFRRTFTMTEFARLAQPGAGDPRQVVAAAAAVRAAAAPVAEDDDLPDPYGLPAAAAIDVAGRLTELVQVWLDALGLSPRRLASVPAAGTAG
jgi:protein-tyrosine-phosphatase